MLLTCHQGRSKEVDILNQSEIEQLKPKNYRILKCLKNGFFLVFYTAGSAHFCSLTTGHLADRVEDEKQASIQIFRRRCILARIAENQYIFVRIETNGEGKKVLAVRNHLGAEDRAVLRDSSYLRIQDYSLFKYDQGDLRHLKRYSLPGKQHKEVYVGLRSFSKRPKDGLFQPKRECQLSRYIFSVDAKRSLWVKEAISMRRTDIHRILVGSCLNNYFKNLEILELDMNFEIKGVVGGEVEVLVTVDSLPPRRRFYNFFFQKNSQKIEIDDKQELMKSRGDVKPFVIGMKLWSEYVIFQCENFHFFILDLKSGKVIPKRSNLQSRDPETSLGVITDKIRDFKNGDPSKTNLVLLT